MKPQTTPPPRGLVAVAWRVLLGYLHSLAWSQINGEHIGKSIPQFRSRLQKLAFALGYLHRIAPLTGDCSKIVESIWIDGRRGQILDGYRQLKECANPVNLNWGSNTLVCGHE